MKGAVDNIDANKNNVMMHDVFAGWAELSANLDFLSG